jgi:hypothetical protein
VKRVEVVVLGEDVAQTPNVITQNTRTGEKDENAI